MDIDQLGANICRNPTLEGTAEPRDGWVRWVSAGGAATASAPSEFKIWTDDRLCNFLNPGTGSKAGAAYGAYARQYVYAGDWLTATCVVSNVAEQPAGSNVGVQLKNSDTTTLAKTTITAVDDLQRMTIVAQATENGIPMIVFDWANPSPTSDFKKIAVLTGTVGLYVTSTDPRTWEGGGGDPGDPGDPPAFLAGGPRLYTDRVTLYLGDNPGVTVAAQVFPLGTQDTVDNFAELVKTRYRVLLSPSLDIGLIDATDIKISWDVHQYNPVSNTGGLRVDGSVERHYRRGRLHHYELTTQEII